MSIAGNYDFGAAFLSGESIPGDHGSSSAGDGRPPVSGMDPQSGRTVRQHPSVRPGEGMSSALVDALRQAGSYLPPPRSPLPLPPPDDADADADVEDVGASSASSATGPLSELSFFSLGDAAVVVSDADPQSGPAAGWRRAGMPEHDGSPVEVTEGEWLVGSYPPRSSSAPADDPDMEAEEADGGAIDDSSPASLDGEPWLSSEDEGSDVVYVDLQLGYVDGRRPERGSLRELRQAQAQSVAPLYVSQLREALETVRRADVSGLGQWGGPAYLRDVACSYDLFGDEVSVVGSVLKRKYDAVSSRAAREALLDRSRRVVAECLRREAAADVPGAARTDGSDLLAD